MATQVSLMPSRSRIAVIQRLHESFLPGARVVGKLAFPCDASLVERITAELLREYVLHLYAQYCIDVRGSLLINHQKQSESSKIWILEAGAGSSNLLTPTNFI